MQYGQAMGSKMTPKGDKFGWLGKTGIVKDVSKSQEAKSQGHAAPTSIQPDGHPNPAMVQKSNWPAPMNNERAPGKDTAASRTRGTKASTANIEGNESAMYEKLEKKSLTSLKGGGTEKELREGHNEVTSAAIGKNTSGSGGGPVATGANAGYQGPRAPQPMAKEKHGMKTPKMPKSVKTVGTGSIAGGVKSGTGSIAGGVKSGTGSIAGGVKAGTGSLASKTLQQGHNTGAPGPKERSMKLGGGGRFAKLKSEIAAKGKVKDPGAVAAAIGRKKYGGKAMAKMSAAGRKK